MQLPKSVSCRGPAEPTISGCRVWRAQSGARGWGCPLASGGERNRRCSHFGFSAVALSRWQAHSDGPSLLGTTALSRGHGLRCTFCHGSHTHCQWQLPYWCSLPPGSMNAPQMLFHFPGAWGCDKGLIPCEAQEFCGVGFCNACTLKLVSSGYLNSGTTAFVSTW